MIHKSCTALEWSVKIFNWRALNRFHGAPTSLLVQMWIKTHSCLVCMKYPLFINPSSPRTYKSRYKKDKDSTVKPEYWVKRDPRGKPLHGRIQKFFLRGSNFENVFFSKKNPFIFVIFQRGVRTPCPRFWSRTCHVGLTKANYHVFTPSLYSIRCFCVSSKQDTRSF